MKCPQVTRPATEEIMTQKTGTYHRMFEFLKHNGMWFKIVIIISVLVRLYLAILTEGTYDVEIWNKHISVINKIGLIEYYKTTQGSERAYNHPPAISSFITGILHVGDLLRIPFKIIFRLFFASLDFVTAFYLLKIFKNNTYKYLLTASYLLNPATFILSAYHGNTDSSLGLFILAAAYYLSQKKYMLSGIILGLGSWVKWIVFLPAPVLLFAILGIKNKGRFIASTICASLLGYFMVLVKAPGALINSVWKYGGQMIQTTAGIPVWGNRILYGNFVQLYSKISNFPTPEIFQRWLHWYLSHNSVLIFIVIALYSWLQRNRRDGIGMCRTIAEVFCIFYAMTNFWSFQYFAWAAPFWVFLAPLLLIVVSFFTSGYIYLFYSFVCGSCLLQGRWDFLGHPHPPTSVLFFRDLSILIFIVSSIFFFFSALSKNISDIRGRDEART